MPKKKNSALKLPFIPFLSVILLVVSTFLSYNLSSYFIKIQGNNGKYDPNETIAYFEGKKVNIPGEIHENWANTYVLGSSKSRDNKRIEVDLTKQTLYAYEGDEQVYEFKISSGKWGRTPTGEFRIWTKLRYALMTGGNASKHTYYYLPNVPYTMYFYGPNATKAQGYSLHGTYWHDNFGNPMSHGCINMKTEEAEKIFYWTRPEIDEDTNILNASTEDPGTRIIIYGEPPES